jgi:hypothetical protein
LIWGASSACNDISENSVVLYLDAEAIMKGEKN